MAAIIHIIIPVSSTDTEQYNNFNLTEFIKNSLESVDSYNIYFDITNILDKKYETAQDYSQMDRSFNFGIKKTLPHIFGVAFGFTFLIFLLN